MKVVLCVEPVVLHVGQFLLRMAIFPVFDFNHGFSLMVDDLPLKIMTWHAIMIDK